MATIRTRKRGKTWSYSFEIGKNPETGRRKMKEKGGFATQDEAYDAGVEAYADWKHGNIGITSSKVSLDNFFNAWIAVVKESVKPSTLEEYRMTYRNRVSEIIGHIAVQELRPRDIDRLIRTLVKKGYSRNSIVNSVAVVKNALRYAVYPAELITANPCDAIRIPTVNQGKAVKRSIVTKEQFAGLMWEYPLGSRHHMALALAYYTGMRIGEVIGLDWSDVSLKDGMIHIKRQSIRIDNRESNYYTSPKSQSSIRTIAAGETLLAELKRWKLMQQENAMHLGGAYQCVYADEQTGRTTILPKCDAQPEGTVLMHPICTDRFGVPVSRSSFSAMLKKHDLNAHSFRHTHATRLIEAGAKPVEVAARLGHADVSITENLYTHVTDKMRKDIGHMVDNIM